MVHRALDSKTRWLAIGIGILICLMSFFTFFRGYASPAKLYWDENYHIASAQKYLHGVFFMEPHPPLGKLLLAAGEKLLKPNSESNQFLDTMYIKKIPKGFSFKGYRFFPALLAWWTAPLLFICLVLLLGRPLLAALYTLPFIFDNALVVHLRGAMLDGPHLFFVVLTLLFFLRLLRTQEGGKHTALFSLLFGVSLACTASIKLNGLILVLLYPAMLYALYPRWARIRDLLFFSGSSFLLIFFSLFYLHFALCSEVHSSLPKKGYFRASDEYKAILSEGSNTELRHFPRMLVDSFTHSSRYQKGVPRLNLCKQKENGSPSFLWPIGARSINYRWKREVKDVYRYLYLQSNPLVWLPAFAGVLFALCLMVSSFFFSTGRELKYGFYLKTFLLMYLSYMIVMACLDRVMYLYHYFIPLLFSFIILPLVSAEITNLGPFRLSARFKTTVLCCWSIGLVLVFRLYSPLTYYQPIENSSVKRLALLSAWDLRCPACPLTNRIASPQKKSSRSLRSLRKLRLGPLPAYHSDQDWGEPAFGRTVAGKPLIVAGVRYEKGFGVHANSLLKFRPNKRYSRLSGLVGLPDYMKSRQASVIFEIYGDGKQLWRSALLRAGDAAVAFDVSLEDITVLELRVDDAGDGIDYDHACWLNMDIKRRKIIPKKKNS